MRLDHLLSKENRIRETLSDSGIGQGIEGEAFKGSEVLLFNFEGLRKAFKRGEKKPKEKRVGGVAQLGEHLPCTQGVRSSILLISTTAP